MIKSYCCKSFGVILLLIQILYTPAFALETLSLSEEHVVYHQETNTPTLSLVSINDTRQLATRHFQGKGIPLVFVHGSWDDHHSWLPIADALSTQLDNPIIIYDRHGHSASSPDTHQGSISQDVNDAIQLIHRLGYDQAHFIGHSYGANIVMEIASHDSKVAKSIVLYEPPLFGLLKNKPEYQQNLQKVHLAMQSAKELLQQGQIESGTHKFVEEVAFGQDSWNNIFDDRSRATMMASYRTWLDQANDPERLDLKVQPLNTYQGKITILYGTDSIAAYQNIIQELDQAIDHKSLIAIHGAGHGGITSHVNQTSVAILQHLE